MCGTPSSGADGPAPARTAAAARSPASIASITAEPLGLLDDPRAARLVEVVRLPRAYPVPDLALMDAIRAPAAWLTALEGVHLAPGSAVIEAIEAGERAAAAVLAGAGPSAPDDGVPHIS